MSKHNLSEKCNFINLSSFLEREKIIYFLSLKYDHTVLTAQTDGLMAAGSPNKAAPAGVTSSESTPELGPENRVYPTITGSRWQRNTRA